MWRQGDFTRFVGTCIGAGFLLAAWDAAHGHHSFAMYDSEETYVITGVVTRVDPNPNHLQMFIAPLDDAREKVVRDADDEPVVWAVEFKSASAEARNGITVNSFPRGTIVSVGLHPLRNGYPGGGRGDSGLFKCPPETPPALGQHCDSVEGADSYGGELPEPTRALPEE